MSETVEDIREELENIFYDGSDHGEKLADSIIGRTITAHERAQWNQASELPKKYQLVATDVGIGWYSRLREHWCNQHDMPIDPKIWRELPIPPEGAEHDK